MTGYSETIKMAIVFFPLIAFIISIPFILSQYHKFGSISFFKALIIYSFTLYLMCAYFLIILPLPKISEVALLQTPRVQLIPFSFIIDFIKNTSFNITDINTYIKTLKESYFYVPIYNIFLTLPFSIYLRYYFKCDMKKVALYSFLLSLFFELTQLSGLYFIYPRGYRLFDVDDLLLNTLGGVLGYLISKPIINLLPKKEEINTKALERGKIISGFRRSTAFILDLFIVTMLGIIASIFIKNKHCFEVTIIIYYFIIPLFFKSSTLGELFLNIKVVDENNKNNIYRTIFRRILFIVIYFIIPFVGASILDHININCILKEFIVISFFGTYFIFYVVTANKYFFTNKEMIYEKLSKTKLISTIKTKDD